MARKFISNKFMIEQLEPRLLFSADLQPMPIESVLPNEDGMVDISGVEAALMADSIESHGAVADEMQRHEVVFVDAGVPDYRQLVDDMLEGHDDGRQIELIILDSSRDGIFQISETLARYQDIDAVHVVSHGTDGAVQLGNTWLTKDTIDVYAGSIEGWRYALTGEADLLFYGCELVSGEDGRSLIDSLAFLTGADIAASDDPTGSEALGGDWTLEVKTGQIDTIEIRSSYNWQGVLDLVNVNTAADTYIDRDDQSYNFGNSSSLEVDPSGGGIGDKRILLQFDLSAVPAGATITGATLKMEATANTGAFDINIYELTESWVEGSGDDTPGVANWDQRQAATNWTSAGGEYDPTVVATLNSSSTGQHSWDITSLVQAWYGGSKVNNGIIIGSPDGGGNTVTYDSSEGTGIEPVLEINYTPPGNTAPTISGTLAGQAVNDNGTISPFSGVTIGDADLPAQTLSVSVTLDVAAKGAFTTLNGFTDAGGGVYTFSGTAAAATSAIQGMVFDPTDNRVAPTLTETTTFTISVDDGSGPVTDNITTVVSTSINDAPVINPAATPVLNDVAENSGAAAGAVGTQIWDLIDLPGGGGLDNVTDADISAVTGIAVTSADTTNGTWHYTIDGGASWNPLGAVTVLNARLLAADANTRIYFQPNPAWNGTVLPGIWFRAWDQTSGVNGGMASTAIPGGTSAFSTAQDSASITVTSVNNAPTIGGCTAGQGVNDTAAISPFSGVTIGDADLPAQTLSVSVTLDDANKGAFTTLNGFTDAGGGVYTFSGTAAAATAAIQGMVFDPTDNRVAPGLTETTTFTISVNDGSGPVTDNTTTVISTSVNDAPAATNINAAETYTEDTVLNLTDIAVSDTDSANVTVTLTLSDPSAGALSIGTSGAVTSSFAGGVWTASGAISDVNSLLAGVVFTPSAGYNSNFTINVSVDDGGSTPLTGIKTITGIPLISSPIETDPVDEVTEPEPEELEEMEEEVLIDAEMLISTSPSTSGTHEDSKESKTLPQSIKFVGSRSATTTPVRMDRTAAPENNHQHVPIQEKPVLASLSKLQNALNSLGIERVTIKAYEHLRNALDSIKKEVSEEIQFDKTVIGSAITASTGLSVGYVVWLIRGGTLISSVLSSMPAWQLADPLPILTRTRDEEDPDDESIETIIKKGSRNDDNKEKEPDVSSDSETNDG